MTHRLVLIFLLLACCALLPGDAAKQTAEPESIASHGEESLGIVLSVPFHKDGGMQADLDALREYLDMPDAGEEELQRATNMLALAAIQGLYEQIRARDELLLQLNDQNRALLAQLNGVETENREARARLNRLETRLNDTRRNQERVERGESPTTLEQSARSVRGVPSPSSALEGTSRVQQRMRQMEDRMDSTSRRINRQVRENQRRLEPDSRR